MTKDELATFNLKMSLYGWVYTEQCTNKIYLGKWSESSTNRVFAFLANKERGLARYWSRKPGSLSSIVHSYAEIWSIVSND
ncbi:MAG: hypothetical protein HRU18_02640 [Pseudoalteromonas sp.]|uniref:hypothetical protein n=1 Tax=Pseudoalteromonas sp. TaxID=53249 RepID=UPI001DFE93A1|nr:hypothetical protein [Pseudoalteromonas sp.]NRA77081.1 hypothetical protein [Pseudoalteromonas sp.]